MIQAWIKSTRALPARGVSQREKYSFEFRGAFAVFFDNDIKPESRFAFVAQCGAKTLQRRGSWLLTNSANCFAHRPKKTN